LIVFSDFICFGFLFSVLTIILLYFIHLLLNVTGFAQIQKYKRKRLFLIHISTWSIHLWAVTCWQPKWVKWALYVI